MDVSEQPITQVNALISLVANPGPAHLNVKPFSLQTKNSRLMVEHGARCLCLLILGVN
jgi:hypothetical protein